MDLTFAPIRRSAYALALAAAAYFGVPTAHAAVYTLEDTGLNSSLVIDTATGNAVDWFVEGVDQIYNRQYFFRVGAPSASNPELAVNDSNLNLVNTSFTDANFDPGNESLSLRFLDPNQRFQITTATSLAGGFPGSNQATFTESMRIDNLSRTSPLSISIFLYADYDLGNGGNSDSVSFGNSKTVTQVGSGWIHEASVTVSPTNYEASIYPALINSLQDLGSTTLSNVASVVNADGVYGFQWDLVIAPRRSFTIGNTNSITVPEASTMLLVGMACVSGLVVARRRSR